MFSKLYKPKHFLVQSACEKKGVVLFLSSSEKYEP